jgi:hypothetical protein
MVNYRNDYRELLAVLRTDVDNETKLALVLRFKERVASDDTLPFPAREQLLRNLGRHVTRITHRMKGE